MGEARRRKLLGLTQPMDPKRKYREKKPSNVAKVLVYGKKHNPLYGRNRIDERQ